MSNAVQIAKIVEAALVGDLQKVQNYAELIATHFQQDGNERAARIVRRSYGAEPKGSPVNLDGSSPAIRELARQRCSTPDCDCYAGHHCFAYTNGHFMPEAAATQKKQDGWIGVDLDGTLAHYDGWKGIDHIGEPVATMQERVKTWLAQGKYVKIFTARVFDPSPEVLRPIEAWCRKHLGRSLPVTCVKDMAMTELWDDRAVQVNINTGLRADGRED